MYTLYLDESGELGTKAGSSDYFQIAIISTDVPKSLKNRMRKEKDRLYKRGWPRDLEIKGTNLFQSHRNPNVPAEISENRIATIERIIRRILNGSIFIHYSIARKSRLAPHILQAPYGIAYNYLAGKLLTRAYPDYFAGQLHLLIDQRTKETHDKLTFDGYIQTVMVSECHHIGRFDIQHRESHEVLGIQAVDFISWGLFRYFEHDDPTYKAIIDPSVGYCDRWYPGK